MTTGKHLNILEIIPILFSPSFEVRLDIECLLLDSKPFNRLVLTIATYEYDRHGGKGTRHHNSARGLSLQVAYTFSLKPVYWQQAHADRHID